MTTTITPSNDSPSKRDTDYSNLLELFERSTHLYKDKIALNFVGKEMSYQQLGEQVELLAIGLQKMGVGPGVHVGICLPNTQYSVIAYYAILKAGGVVVNFNPLYTSHELKYQIEDSGIKIMITIDLELILSKLGPLLDSTGMESIIAASMAEALPGLKSFLFRMIKAKELANIKGHKHIYALGNVIALGLAHKIKEGDDALEIHEIEPNQLAVLQYTGGTTGVPKGAMLSHQNLASNVNQVRDRMEGLSPGEERFLCVLPFFHVFAMTGLMNQGLSVGAKLYLLPRFDLKQCLGAISRYKITTFPAVPSIYTAIVNYSQLKNFNLSSLKYCISGGAPLPVPLRHQFAQLTGTRIVEGYGLSESSPVLTIHPLTGEYRDGSIGTPVRDTTITIRDPENPDKEMPIGERGEVCASGPQIMQGYWQKEEATKDTLKNGRLHTGDIGIMDEDGFIYIVDRIKDLIIVNGYNVYPRNIEEALYKHDGVAECIVIGVDDKDKGQAPKAFVKKAEDHEELDENTLKAHLGEYLSKIEMPREIEFRDELPKTMIGKLSKKELVEEEAAKAK